MADLPLPPGWTAATRSRFQAALRRWFLAQQRPLPWRTNRDPYRIWVSEVMLQQTTVAAVVPFFERFLTTFPTVQALAAADEQAVLTHWAGLGYYRRARHLHTAARQLVAEQGGTLPDDPAVWAALPGVGRYILGAVLSQAFERPLPVVEANTLRVISRLYASRLDPREGAGKAWVWQAAAALLPNQHIGDFNQAMMELGALVCTPVAPRCAACPAAKWCVAHKQGVEAEIPPPAKRKTIVEVAEVAVVIRAGDRVLWCCRAPTASRSANMWEVPHGEPLLGESVAATAERLAAQVGVQIAQVQERLTIKHGVTRFAITMVCVEGVRAGGEFTPTPEHPIGRWLTLAELAEYPISSPQRQLARALARPDPQGRLF